MIDMDSIVYIDKWLDDNVNPNYTELAQHWARVTKTSEEIGETISELIAWTGQNLRKNNQYDPEAFVRMLDEMADVAITAILGIQHFTKERHNTMNIVSSRLKRLHQRILFKWLMKSKSSD